MLDRRALLTTTASAAAAAALPDTALAAPGSRADLDRLFDTLFREDLRERPESATQLGLDHGADADLKFKLSDESRAGQDRAHALTRSQLARLKAFDPSALSPADRLSYEAVLYTRQTGVDAQRFDFGGAAFSPSPYVVSQLTGAYQAIPTFLDTKHRIETREDADAYLSRLSAFAGQLDDNTAQMKHDAGLGVVAPDFDLGPSPCVGLRFDRWFKGLNRIELVDACAAQVRRPVRYRRGQ